MMNEVKEQVVRIRAYYIWEREGRPEGREAEHWHAALRELEIETIVSNGAGESSSNGTNGEVSTSKSKAKPAAAPRKSRIGSIAAKAKNALEGGAATDKPVAEPKRKRAPKADKDPGKRSPRTS
jgi:hypothetical protein